MRIKVARLLETDTSLIFDEDYGQNEKVKTIRILNGR